METISLVLNRAGINGLEGKEDAEHVTEWVKVAFTAVTEAGAQPAMHLLIRRVVDKFEKLDAKATSIELEPMDLHLIRWALLSANFPGHSAKMACLILNLFGITL